MAKKVTATSSARTGPGKVEAREKEIWAQPASAHGEQKQGSSKKGQAKVKEEESPEIDSNVASGATGL